MEWRAQERQLDLLMLAAGNLLLQRFDPMRRPEIVSLLKVLLNDRLAAARLQEADND